MWTVGVSCGSGDGDQGAVDDGTTAPAIVASPVCLVTATLIKVTHQAAVVVWGEGFASAIVGVGKPGCPAHWSTRGTAYSEAQEASCASHMHHSSRRLAGTLVSFTSGAWVAVMACAFSQLRRDATVGVGLLSTSTRDDMAEHQASWSFHRRTSNLLSKWGG
ncbi:hypothetical protein PG994_011936 [Apiospora phragmitis]|uniref:Uncharacterized protein n=1 Tax=Apiospora phragmitis TaxID=2905665 RepID=A0ABR1TU89_9PEZI